MNSLLRYPFFRSRKSIVNATRRFLTIFYASVLMLGCRQAVEPPGEVIERVPGSIQVDGTKWVRLPGDPTDDPRLERVFRERKDLAESPDLGGTLVAYNTSSTGDRVRFVWIQAWSDSDGWTWIETNEDGKYLASGQEAGTRFPSSGSKG